MKLLGTISLTEPTDVFSVVTDQELVAMDLSPVRNPNSATHILIQWHQNGETTIAGSNADQTVGYKEIHVDWHVDILTAQHIWSLSQRLELRD